jgi:hypothetical protein
VLIFHYCDDDDDVVVFVRGDGASVRRPEQGRNSVSSMSVYSLPASELQIDCMIFYAAVIITVSILVRRSGCCRGALV